MVNYLKQKFVSRSRGITTLIVVIALFGLLLVAMDWEEMRLVLIQADWKPLTGAIFFTAVSYICVSYAFAFVGKILGIQMGQHEMAEVGFVSTIINHVLTSGGVVGYSVRILLMRMYGVKTKDVLAASILHFYLTSLDMLLMLPVAILLLMLNASVARGVAVILGLMTVLGALVFILASAIIFIPSIRKPLIDFLVRVGSSILRKDLRPTLENYDVTLSRGAQAIQKQPLMLILIMVFTWVDFISSILVLGFCFDALGPPVRFDILLSGFVIGVMAGVLSMIPGGIGVQESSMAGVFLLLGISFSQAVLAAILFRVIFFLLPYFVSLGFYRRIYRKAERSAQKTQKGSVPCEF